LLLTTFSVFATASRRLEEVDPIDALFNLAAQCPVAGGSQTDCDPVKSELQNCLGDEACAGHLAIDGEITECCAAFVLVTFEGAYNHLTPRPTASPVPTIDESYLPDCDLPTWTNSLSFSASASAAQNCVLTTDEWLDNDHACYCLVFIPETPSMARCKIPGYQESMLSLRNACLVQHPQREVFEECQNLKEWAANLVFLLPAVVLLDCMPLIPLMIDADQLTHDQGCKCFKRIPENVMAPMNCAVTERTDSISVYEFWLECHNWQHDGTVVVPTLRPTPSPYDDSHDQGLPELCAIYSKKDCKKSNQCIYKKKKCIVPPPCGSYTKKKKCGKAGCTWNGRCT